MPKGGQVVSKLHELLAEPPRGEGEERWAMLPDSDGMYYVSTLGRLFSVPRRVERPDGRLVRVAGGYLTQQPAEANMSVPGPDGHYVSRTVAWLVLTCFCRPGRPGENAVQKEYGRGVRLGNLEWQPREAYVRSAKRRRALAGHSTRETLTAGQVLNLRANPPLTAAAKLEEARRLGVSLTALRAVLRGDSWKSLSQTPT